MTEDIKLEKINEDVRGSIHSLKFKDKFEDKDEDRELIIVISKKGAPRGGHYHDKNQTHVVLHGSYDYREVDPNKPNMEIKRVVKIGDVLRIKAGKAHMLTALEDSAFLEFGRRKKTVYYPPYRKVVDDYIAKRQN